MNRNSIKFRIPFFIMVFALGCVFITGLVFQYVATQHLETNVINKNLVISKMVSNHISLYLEDAESTVVTAANFSSQSPKNIEKIRQEIFRIYDNFEYFDLIFYMNTDAQMVFSKPSNEHVKSRRYTDRSYYWDVMKGKKVTISPLIVSSVLDMPHFIIAASVDDRKGDTIGLIGAGLPLYNIERVIEKTQKEFDGKIWLVDENGILAVHPDYNTYEDLVELDNIKVSVNGKETDFRTILRNKKETIANYTIGEKEYYGAITFVPGVDWMVVVEQDQDIIFSEVIEVKRQLKNIMFFVILLAFVFGLIIAKGITNPIEKLVRQVKRLSYELKARKPIELDFDTHDEIGELSRAFSDMSLRLGENLMDLEDSYNRENKLQQYLNNILKSVTSGIVVIDRESIITIFNNEAEVITGFSSSDFLNKKVDVFLQNIQLEMSNLIKDVLYEGKAFADIEEIIINKRGKEIPLSISASQVLDDNKRVIGVVVLFRDITRIKIIENELKKDDRIRTLGELSASIIHDIGNPLAGISNLIEILKDNTIDRETNTEVLDILEKEVHDLNKLVINFLEFGRSSNLEKKNTDINRLINDIVNLLKPEIIDKEITINKQYLNGIVFADVDRRSIKQAMINIFKNAIQAIDINGRIHITIKEEVDNVSIIVRDDGVGISKEKLEKIFYPFYTTKEEGTGLGLFTAYRVIKEHGGQLKVKSEKDIGTEFLITLPKIG